MATRRMRSFFGGRLFSTSLITRRSRCGRSSVCSCVNCATCNDAPFSNYYTLRTATAACHILNVIALSRGERGRACTQQAVLCSDRWNGRMEGTAREIQHALLHTDEVCGDGGCSRTSSAFFREWRASKSSALGNLLGSRKCSSAHSSFMLFCSGVPVTSSLFLNCQVASSCTTNNHL